MSNQYGSNTRFEGRDFYYHDKKYNIDEIVDYYITQNHSKKETDSHFGIGGCTLTRVFKHYGIRKSRLLSHVHNFKTNMERYGDPNYNNMEQMKKTCLEKYGVDNYFKNTDAIKQANLRKYGVDNPNKLRQTIEKREQTCLAKYGAKSYLMTDEGKAKARNTCLIHYGVTAPMKSKVVREKYDFKKNGEKAFNTKLKNGTTNTSKPEKDTEAFLKDLFGEDNVCCQYKSALYPWHCDFYIKPLDMYVELNLYFTHGGHPFDETNKEDLKKLDIWKEKSKNSKFFANAIKVWTEFDLEKRKMAMQNGLRYETIYNLKQLKKFKEDMKRSYANAIEVKRSDD